MGLRVQGGKYRIRDNSNSNSSVSNTNIVLIILNYYAKLYCTILTLYSTVLNFDHRGTI